MAVGNGCRPETPCGKEDWPFSGVNQDSLQAGIVARPHNVHNLLRWREASSNVRWEDGTWHTVCMDGDNVGDGFRKS